MQNSCILFVNSIELQLFCADMTELCCKGVSSVNNAQYSQQRTKNKTSSIIQQLFSTVSYSYTLFSSVSLKCFETQKTSNKPRNHINAQRPCACWKIVRTGFNADTITRVIKFQLKHTIPPLLIEYLPSNNMAESITMH